MQRGRRILTTLAGSGVALIVGTFAGFLAEWTDALVAIHAGRMGMSDASVPDASWARSSAVIFGAPIGALAGLVCYQLVLRQVPVAVLAKQSPLLVLVAILAAAFGGFIGWGLALFTAPAAVFLAAALIERRWRLKASERSG